jgi:hypothetical protein
MMLMVGGRPRAVLHYWCGKHPGRVGVLLSPQHYEKQINVIPEWCPYALDNDAYTAWANKTEWRVENWRGMLAKMKMQPHKPRWVLVPDVVANRAATLESWQRYAPEAAAYGRPLAFAVQDGMKPDDVPNNAAVIFVGGTTEWKWRTVPMWTQNFPRVHVGRVNELRRLWTCDEYGVESADGSGWMKKTPDGRMAQHLEMWLDGHKNETPELPMAFALHSNGRDERQPPGE